ncbi:aspartate aminotransferase family protein [Parapedobacter pyrenivorans]|uniref:Aspartate aminotransferase family protein n=1 Tax=Parapedobacter pyrenivorans TaxID=1305674 RepID=A0A917HLA7_9SPHI|nr:aspartate aminotransferase family protein [Parapedobacter pyrenivorans]GGG82233.1 aspartate aminotransferase family protein [Parapedobacter pyrenivorans]
MSDTKHTAKHLVEEGDLNLSGQRKQWHDALTDGATQAALQRDADRFLHQALSTPCLDVLASSDGVRLTSLAGKIYVDFHGNNVHQLGYNNSFIIDRVKQQLDTLAFCPRRFTNLPAIELAERLAALTEHRLSRVLFAPGGTSAIGMALKLARIHTGKFKTLAMYDAFHGASMDSISLGGEYVFQQGLGPLMAGSVHVPPVDSYRGMWFNPNDRSGDMAYADYLGYVLEKEGDIGVLVAETVRSTTVHVPSQAYWQRIRELCDQHGVLLVFDEIPIGLGRTGKSFAYQHYGIVPDIVVLGKGLGAGIMPMAAMLCKDELNVAAQVSLGHFTHEKSPLGAAAALAGLDYMDTHDILPHVGRMERIMADRLEAMKATYEAIGDVRGIGLLWGVELVKNRETKAPDAALAERVLYHCLGRGLSFKVSGGNVLSLYPPLVITEDELHRALDILDDAFRSQV